MRLLTPLVVERRNVVLLGSAVAGSASTTTWPAVRPDSTCTLPWPTAPTVTFAASTVLPESTCTEPVPALTPVTAETGTVSTSSAVASVMVTVAVEPAASETGASETVTRTG